MKERKEVLNMFRELWQSGDSSLRRIYSSWEELEASVNIKSERAARKGKTSVQSCPNCGAKQKIVKPLEDFFPYQNCKACKRAFYVNKNLTARKLTEEEREMPSAWVQIVEDMRKKKMAIAFRIE